MMEELKRAEQSSPYIPTSKACADPSSTDPSELSRVHNALRSTSEQRLKDISMTYVGRLEVVGHVLWGGS